MFERMVEKSLKTEEQNLENWIYRHLRSYVILVDWMDGWHL
jgi:hypothetical protein